MNLVCINLEKNLFVSNIKYNYCYKRPYVCATNKNNKNNNTFIIHIQILYSSKLVIVFWVCLLSIFL